MAWVYILRCRDGSYYVGSTRNLSLRLAAHQHGEGAAYTQHRRPVELVFAQEFERIDDAYRVEKQVQGWGRRKREMLIRGDLAGLAGSGSRSTASSRLQGGAEEAQA